MTRNRLLVIGVGLVAVAALVVDAAGLSPRAAWGAGDAARIDELLVGRAGLEQSVLEAHAGLQLNFDPINRASLSLRGASAAADIVRSRDAGGGVAAEQLLLAANALSAEQSALEQFKSDLALLRLSAHEFPLAIDALRRRGEVDLQQRRRTALADALPSLATLRTELELYQGAPSPDGAQRLERALALLEPLSASLDDTAREQLENAFGHARVILDRRERVDRFALLVGRSPVRRHLEAARSAYALWAHGHAQSVGALQALCAVLALAGVGVIASAALRGTRAH